MSNNLILAAAVGYNFKQIELFIKSLRNFYFDKICLIIHRKDINLEKELKKYNCEIIKTNIDKKKIQFKRYEIFLDYLKEKNFDRILLCDSRDVYFQKNPFDFNYHSKINFFLEDFKIKDCPYNSNWIIKTYGKNEYDKISNNTILCSGTVLGDKNKIIEYLKLINVHIKKYKYKKKLKYLLTLRVDPEGRGCDQGHANFIVHKELIKGKNFYKNNEGPFATVFYLKEIKFDDNSKLLNKFGKPYLLVHQYDKRWSEFSNAINFIKKKLDIA
ncbi:MAG: hypothetical protein VXW51_04435 [Pseudomonadota bacterium]|nr:hypothetical protein [Pseudomonadota bacterium]